MADIDHFKRINDRYGHDVGDAVLRRLADHLVANTRAEDVVCRYGGEEFVLILVGSDLDAARHKADELRQGVKHLVIESGGRPIDPIAISMGIAAFPRHGRDGASLLRAADQALLRAKQSGRDRVLVAEG